MSTIRSLPALICLLALPAVGSAQALAREPALALLSARLTSLRTDSSLPDSLRRLTVQELIAPGNTGYVAWLTDEDTQRYMQALADLTLQLPAGPCGRMLDPNSADGTDLDLMLAYGDSFAVTTWAGILVRIVRARAQGRPAGRTATPAEVQSTIAAAIGRLDPQDQTRLITIARNPPPSPADACWSVQEIMAALAALPPADLGPVVRALFGAASLPK